MKVYHINGVLTDRATAKLSNLKALSTLLLSATAPLNTCVVVNLKYNPTNKLKDLLEAIRQRLDTTPKTFWDVIRGTPGSKIFQEMLFRTVFSVVPENYIDHATMNRHVSAYKSDINKSCANVLLVPHSQGNFYANREYDLALQGIDRVPVGSLTIASVANPDSRVAGDPTNGSYANSATDLVINFVRAFAIDTLRGNTNWGIGGPDAFGNCKEDGYLCHAFSGYLKYDESRKRIKGVIESALNAFPQIGCPQFSSGWYSGMSGASPSSAIISIWRGASALEQTVQVETQDDRATATPNIDYTPISVSVTFFPDERVKNVEIPILVNSARTGMVKVPLALSSLSGPLGTQVSAELIIAPSGACLVQNGEANTLAVGCAAVYLSNGERVHWTDGPATLTKASATETVHLLAKALQSGDALTTPQIVLEGEFNGSDNSGFMGGGAGIRQQFFSIQDPEKSGTSGTAHLRILVRMNVSGKAGAEVRVLPPSNIFYEFGRPFAIYKFLSGPDRSEPYSAIESIPFGFVYGTPMLFSVDARIVKQSCGSGDPPPVCQASASVYLQFLGIDIDGGAGPLSDILVGRDAISLGGIDLQPIRDGNDPGFF